MNLETIYTYPPSAHQHIPARINDKERFEAVDAYFYLPDGITSYTDVATGNLFAMVHSPSPYAVVTALFYGQWTVTIYMVVYHKARGIDKEPSRYYREVGTRALTAEETEYFERMRYDK